MEHSVNQNPQEMKKITISSLVTFILLTLSFNVFAQADIIQHNGVPYQTPNSVMWGTDVIIDNQPSENQRGPTLTVAFNGWVYAGFYVNSAAGSHWTVYRSTDDGATWSVFVHQSLNTNWYTSALDIVVTGSSEPTLRLFVARVYQNDVASLTEGKYTIYDGVAGSNLGTPWDDVQSSTSQQFRDIKIVSDYRFPAVDASPYSIAVGYTKYQSSSDTVRVLTSSNGGTTIDGNQLVVATGGYVRNLSLAYGRCANWFNGRYYVAWESRGSTSYDLGAIYTSYSDNHFYDPFTTPVRLDNLMGSQTTDYARNPTISCQFNDIDNDMTNLTAIVLFDRAYNGSTTDYDIVGCYNKEGVSGTTWTPMYLDNVVNMAIQPHLNFDPAYNNFLLTYANITDQKLRYLVMEQSLGDPNNWWVISDKYNENNNLVNPYPQVEINPVYTQTAHMWVGDISGQGVATFDAEYSTIGIKENPASMNLSVSPNPASTEVKFGLDIAKQSEVILFLYNMQGKEVARMVNSSVAPGFKTFTMDVSSLAEGCYLYRISAGNNTGSGRLVVQK